MGLINEAPRGRDITNEDRNSEVSQRGTQRDAEGSEFSYIINCWVFEISDFKNAVTLKTGLWVREGH